MELHIAQIEWQGYRVNSLPVNHVIPVRPIPEYPDGRKAIGMADLWESHAGQGLPGMLWMDPDVAADPDDLAAMTAAVGIWPAMMLTGMVKLWPASTERPEWIWSHRAGTLGQPVASQDSADKPAYVSTGFLWTPAQLLDLALPVMRSWRFIEVDVGLSELALRHDIATYAVPGCRPKHLHF